MFYVLAAIAGAIVVPVVAYLLFLVAALNGKIWFGGK